MGDSQVGPEERGHLVLDERGRVEGASCDPELLEGPDSPTAGERLESSGVSPFLRRHAVLTRTSAVLLAFAAVGLGAWVVHVQGLPPDDDGVVAVDVTGTGMEQYAPPVGLVQAGYHLIPERAGDTLRLLGLVGPGVRDSAASDTAREPSSSDRIDGLVSVVPDCDDPTTVTAQQHDYHLRVERTDAWGSTVVGLVDLPDVTGVQWAGQIAQACAQRWFDGGIVTESITTTGIRSESGAPLLDVRAMLRNSLAVDVLATYGYSGFGWTVRLPEGVTNTGTLAAGTTSPVRFVVPVDDCVTASADTLGLTTPGGVQGMVLRPASASPVDPTVTASLGLATTAVLERGIDATLRSLCAGMPAYSLDVVSASDSGMRLRLVLRVRAKAEAVRLADPDPFSGTGGALPEMTDAAAALRRGSADLVVGWLTDCDPDKPPPRLSIVVSARGRAWPAQVALVDPTLTRAYLDRCAYVTADELVRNGWALPAP